MNEHRVLLIGSGAREHAIARALVKSVNKPEIFYCAELNNPAMDQITAAFCPTKINNAKKIVDFGKKHDVKLAIIGPEAALYAGVADELENNGIPCIGPKKNLATIETSKGFARDLMFKYNIPYSPRFKYFEYYDRSLVTACLEEYGDNYVIKQDGLCSGKGVKVFNEHLFSLEETLQHCSDIKQSFLIEEKLTGPEFSLISISDGQTVKHFPLVQDHKRAFCNDTGPNTGGMGSYSLENHLLPFVNSSEAALAQEINEQVISALQNECQDKYIGILYGGYMLTDDGIKVIEFNARLGDPEAINLLSVIDNDFYDLCRNIINQKLFSIDLKFKQNATVVKYLVPQGYPETIDKAVLTTPIELSTYLNHKNVFFAGITQDKQELYMTGSRALAVLGVGESIEKAELQAELLAQCLISNLNLSSDIVFYRPDIGTRELINKYINLTLNNSSYFLRVYNESISESISESIGEPRKFSNSSKTSELSLPKVKLKLAVLGSTNGSNLEKFYLGLKRQVRSTSVEPESKLELALVISNIAEAGIVLKAQKLGIATHTIMSKDKSGFEAQLHHLLQANNIDLIVLMGFMKILSKDFTDKWPRKIINIHPSLLPKYAGMMDLAVHQAAIDSGDKYTGCTVHWVNEKIDGGPIIMQKTCMIEAGDSPQQLKSRVQQLEIEALLSIINKVTCDAAV